MNTSYKIILAEYRNWLDTLGYSKHLIGYCGTGGKLLLQWLESKQINSINLLNDKHIRDYHVHLETRRSMSGKKENLLGAGQLNHLYFAADKFLEFLHHYGVSNAPAPTNKRIRTSEIDRIKKLDILTQDEVKTLYNCISDTYQRYNFAIRQEKHYELKLIFALYYGCGLRISEGENLQIKDIDFDKRTVFVKQGKGYKDRIVPMSAGVYKELQDYIYNFRCRYKINHSRLFMIKGATIGVRLKRLQQTCSDKTIKAKHLHIHILRHSIATHLLQNGMSIENISLFLGHSSLESTQIYTHILNQ
ncbi:MAG: tyrosine-type recombinase/integrase [Prevotellaceae bacterium]|jgi:integrase/recombinase XerD|nr:tyrosine-type recombinase/integrase [Prevotellaceae bacterium]